MTRVRKTVELTIKALILSWSGYELPPGVEIRTPKMVCSNLVAQARKGDGRLSCQPLLRTFTAEIYESQGNVLMKFQQSQCQSLATPVQTHGQ